MSSPGQVHAFWFDGDAEKGQMKKWFFGGEDFDAKIREQFSHTVEAALQGDLGAEWESDLQSKVSKILLLDQFPRNLFRGTAKAFSGDQEAVRLSHTIIEKGLVKQLSTFERCFAIIIPLEHSENITDHELAAKLVSEWIQECTVAKPEKLTDIYPIANYLEDHSKVIRQFGRYPSRNEALGRESTAEEIHYLANDVPDWAASQKKV